MAYAASDCEHHELCVSPSSRLACTNFKDFSKELKAKAATSTSNVQLESQLTFPSPLILPGDDLALEKESAQSLRSWLRETHRNKITYDRRTIYVVSPPTVSAEIDFIADWTKPTKKPNGGPNTWTQPDMTMILDYVAAFYHGLPVKLLPPDTFQFSAWEDSAQYTKHLKAKKITKSKLIGLDTGREKIGVHLRSSPDSVFSHQLSLNDLIDGAIEMLPRDAYALVMLVNHDLYEDDDDIFVCGRAYGGSRVAVISTARYNPLLDQSLELDTIHAWPNSHCTHFLSATIEAEGEATDKEEMASVIKITDKSSPIAAAVRAVKVFQNTQKESAADLWLGRICRTVSHELGHCFGIGHCVYYACCMQGSASLHEDIRQPPYLCPVDLAKVLRATGARKEDHYGAMLEFCHKYATVELFAAYRAWIQLHLEEETG